MDNKYKEIMSHINVDDEMRDRILANLKDADVSPSVTPIVPSKKRKLTLTRIVPIAAAAVVLVVGGILLSNVLNKDDDVVVKNTNVTREHNKGNNESVDSIPNKNFDGPVGDEECDSEPVEEIEGEEAITEEIEEAPEQVAPDDNSATVGIASDTLVYKAYLEADEHSVTIYTLELKSNNHYVLECDDSEIQNGTYRIDEDIIEFFYKDNDTDRYRLGMIDGEDMDFITMTIDGISLMFTRVN